MTGIHAEIAEEEEPTSASSGGAPHTLAVGCTLWLPCTSGIIDLFFVLQAARRLVDSTK